MKKLTITLLLIIAAAALKAQILHPVKWSYAAKRLNASEAVVLFKAAIDEGWHIYSVNMSEGGPVKTSFTFSPSKDFITNGPVLEPKPISRFEKTFNMEVSYFDHAVVFQQKIKLKAKGPVAVKGSLEYMTCDDHQCLPPENIDFSVMVK